MDCLEPAYAMRVLVVGPPGVGKSTLARAIADKHGLDYISVDSVRYVAGTWDKVSPQELITAVDALLPDQRTGLLKGFVVDTALYDAHDATRGRALLVRHLLLRTSHVVVLNCASPEFAVANVLRRHAERVATATRGDGGAIETDASVAALVRKMTTNWPAIHAALSTFGATTFIRGHLPVLEVDVSSAFTSIDDPRVKAYLDNTARKQWDRQCAALGITQHKTWVR